LWQEKFDIRQRFHEVKLSSVDAESDQNALQSEFRKRRLQRGL
jgi:hypothetical protein